INDRGEIVGRVVNSDNQGTQAYVKGPAGFTLYADPGADKPHGTEFESINNAGVRVGSFTDGAITPHGIVRIGDVTTLLEKTLTPPATAGIFILAVNNLGHMVGGYFAPAASMQHGFFTDGKLFATVAPPGSSSTWLNGINDLGQMVGGYFDDRLQRWRG